MNGVSQDWGYSSGGSNHSRRPPGHSEACLQDSAVCALQRAKFGLENEAGDM